MLLSVLPFLLQALCCSESHFLHESQVVFCGLLACFHRVWVEDRSVCSSLWVLAFTASAACLKAPPPRVVFTSSAFWPPKTCFYRPTGDAETVRYAVLLGKGVTPTNSQNGLR
jgi:hypothetical protein